MAEFSWLQGAGFAAAMAIVGILVAGWQRIKAILGNLYSRMVVTIEMDFPLDRAVRSYLHAKFRKSRFGVRFFSAMTAFVRPKRRWEMVAYETTGRDTSVYWRGWRPVWVHIEEKKEGEGNRSMRISFFRGLFKPTKLVLDAADHWNRLSSGVGFIDWSTDAKRFQIVRIFGSGGQGERHNAIDDNSSKKERRSNELAMYEHKVLGYRNEDLGPEIHEGSALDLLALPGYIQEAIDEAMRWVDSEGWFRSRGVPWRRGWLLHGPPGTGKTSLVRAMAEDLDLPVYLYDLASLSNRELVGAWDEMMEQAPCIALMEDLDSVFDGRDNRLGTSGGGLTFDCLLNTIDGVERADGLFVVITTNTIEKLDLAIGLPMEDAKHGDMPSRPGRVDRVIRLGTLNLAGRQKLATRILCDCPEEMQPVVEAGDGDTGAQFQERCMRIAHKRFWREKESA